MLSRSAGRLLIRDPRVGHDATVMDPSVARRLAERLHWDDREPDGTPSLAHIRRVVQTTPVEARAVAWLHEALERTDVSEHELLRHGLSGDELRALRLLTRSGGSSSDDVFLAHVEFIARAAGFSGRLARLVKLADLEDRCRRPLIRADGWSPPYVRALYVLASPPPSAESLGGVEGSSLTTGRVHHLATPARSIAAADPV